MNKRISSIDTLRAIAIIGMILCSYIGFNSGLPAWMFHAQTPPPTYAFNPSVAGITWVDLVFPFFLFSMGAAFPFSLRKKLEGGASKMSIFAQLLKRWATLTIFALVLGNSAYNIHSSTRPEWQIQLFLMCTWAAMFLSLVRSDKKWINISGMAAICILAFVLRFYFGISLDRGCSDIIIMILANTAFWGGLIWLLTRDSIGLRWLVILFTAAVKAYFSYLPEMHSAIHTPACLSWIFNFEWLQYLLIVLPASIAGDAILEHSRSGKVLEFGKKDVIAAFISIAAVLIQLWGLYLRAVLADFIASALLALAFLVLSGKKSNVYTDIGRMGFALLLVGIAFDPLDGGITKDYCNLSYLFTTGGMALLATDFLLLLEFHFGTKSAFISGIGQNPMVAYTVCGFLIYPLFTLLGIAPLISSLANGNQFWGLVQGLIFTALMMCSTYLCTRLKLFWKS